MNEINSSFTKTEVFAGISDYFDIYPVKLYASLANVHKQQLLNELEHKYRVIKKNKIKKIF